MTIEERFVYEAKSIEALPIVDKKTGEEFHCAPEEHLLVDIKLRVEDVKKEFTNNKVFYRILSVRYDFDQATRKKVEKKSETEDFLEEDPAYCLRLPYEKFEAMGKPARIVRTSTFKKLE